MNNDKVTTIMQFVKGGQPHRKANYIRMIECYPDGSKCIIEKSSCPCIDIDLEILLIMSGLECASSEDEVLQRDGIII